MKFVPDSCQTEEKIGEVIDHPPWIGKFSVMHLELSLFRQSEQEISDQITKTL
ncbi:hypothetical protein D082_11860 [Synechocystis sp. PCC 6714]|nr:hypothetical protein D082_11860 [Synechocystis sp. PCC 6714]